MSETTTETTQSAPSSFAEAAVALEASSASPPPETTTTESIAPAATTQAVDGVTDGHASTQTEPKGEPPAWRWQDILENARKASAKEAEDRTRQEYAWAKDLADESERQGLMVWRAAMHGDPQALRQIKGNAQAMQWLRGLTTETPAAVDTEPEPDLQAGDGTLVYSAPQQRKWQDWKERQLEAKFDQKLQPFQTVAQSFQQEKATAAYTTSVSQVIASMAAKDPAFSEHKAAVAQVLQADQRLLALALGTETAPPDPATAIEVAWGRVHREQVLPTLSQRERSSVLADIHHKSAATTVNPSRTTVSNQSRPRDFYEAVAQLQK